MSRNLLEPAVNWDLSRQAVERFIKVAAPAAQIVRQSVPFLPRNRVHVLLQPDTFELHIGLDKSATDSQAEAWEFGLRSQGFDKVEVAPIDSAPRRFGKEPWVWLKQAVDPTLATAAKFLNYAPSSVNQLFGGPSPLAAALTSGLVGAGLGYGAGALGEQFLPPSDFNHGTLRRNAAIAGAAALASPALLWGASAHTAHPETPGMRAWISGWPFRPQDMDSAIDKAHKHLPTILKNEGMTLKKNRQPGLEKLAEAYDLMGMDKSAWWEDEDQDQPMGHGLDTLATMPMIDKNDFGRAVWSDPNTPLHIRAATTGLVNSASWANGNSPFVSPWDVARVTAAGAARGLLVGKTLGVLAGLKPESQQNLQRLGVWGGMLSAVIPNAFPDPGRLFR